MMQRGILGVLLVLSGCAPQASSSVPADGRGGPPHGLRSFSSCRALELTLENRFLDVLRQDLRWHLSNPYYRAQEQAKDEPAAYTTTNLQTAGVDEGDVVKNDARTIYAIEGRSVIVMRSWPPEELSEVARITLEGWPREMLLDGKGRLVVASTFSPESSEERTVPFRSGESTIVSIFDVSEPSRPSLVEAVRTAGYFRALRRTGSRVQILTDEWYWSPWNWLTEVTGNAKPIDDPRLLEARVEEIMRKLAPRVKAFTLSDWLGRVDVRRGAGAWTGEPLTEGACRSVLWSGNTNDLAMGRVLSVDLEARGFRRHGLTAILGRIDGFYASPEALWLTEVDPAWDGDPDEWTYLHRFDTRSGGRITYEASGRVEGSTVNSFAFDEHEGHLRVATTRLVPGSDGPVPVNRVSVLRRQGSELRIVGRTPDFEKGERIYAVRFAGKRGFVVTFRQVDPLLTLDLGNPLEPRIVGELKVPGFSTYLHFLDEDHLLTVGQHVPPPLPDGSPSGEPSTMKISLFDVSDFARPREVQSHALPVGDWSEAYWDHRAFTYFPARGVLAIPVSGWNATARADEPWQMYSGLKIFDVSTERGISPRGELSLSDLQITQRFEGWEWTQRAYVRRSILADDYVYALSDLGVRAAHLQSLASPVATVVFKPRE